MNVFIAEECSGIIREAFAAYGHNSWSCDLKAAERKGNHLQGDVMQYLGKCKANNYTHWDLLIAHPPCTYLTVTANKWLKEQPERKSGALVGEARQAARKEAVKFFKAHWIEDIEMICIENPVGIMSTVWKEPTQIIQPYEYGHKEPKQTCLWLKKLPLLRPTKIVEPEYHTTKSGKKMPLWYAYADKSNGQEARAEIRSRTFEGVAAAMADQWSKPFIYQPQLF